MDSLITKLVRIRQRTFDSLNQVQTGKDQSHHSSHKKISYCLIGPSQKQVYTVSRFEYTGEKKVIVQYLVGVDKKTNDVFDDLMLLSR